MSATTMVTTMRRQRTRKPAARVHRPRTAFVLSGGASLGALQVGMLSALYQYGVAADLLVATSVGALNAAFVSSRPQTPETAEELGRVWCALQREDVFPVSLGALVGGLRGHRDHLVPAGALRLQVRRYLEFEDLAEASVPLHLVAFDVIAGREVLLSDGPAHDAVAAAAALPGVFPPVQIGERCLIDGGVVNNTPISHAVELGAERIYVLPTQKRRNPLGRPPRGALDTAIYGLLVDGRLEADVARYSREAELIILPAANPRRVQPTDFEHSSHLIGQGRAASRSLLARSSNVHERRASPPPARRRRGAPAGQEGALHVP